MQKLFVICLLSWGLISQVSLAANELTFIINQDTSLLARLSLLNSHGTNILWEDDNGELTELPQAVTLESTTPFLSSEGSGYFSLYAVYQVFENNIFINERVIIDMSEEGCFINGGNEEYAFSTQKYSYHVKVTSSPFEPDNTNCEILTTVTQNAGPTPSINVSFYNKSHTSPIPSEPFQGTGTLINGTVALGRTPNNQTTCTAAGFADCQTAAHQTLQAGFKSPIFSFVADPTNWLLEGEIHYTLQDPELDVKSEVIVTLQEGDSVLDRCVVEINPVTTGQILYSAEAVATDDNSCQINLVRTLEPLPNSPSMQLIIQNQIAGTSGNSYTYGLLDNNVQVQQGVFNTVFNNIPVNQTQTTTLYALDGAGSSYQSTVNYLFDDYRMSGMPTGLKIEINNDPSADMNQWCKAAITGWNGGYRLYQVSAQVTGTPENATCTVSITGIDNTTTPASYAFKQMSVLPTEGNRQWEYFSINGEHYLAASNSQAQNTSYIKNNMFHFNQTHDAFEGMTNLVVGFRCMDANYKSQFKDHGYSWQYFQVDGRPRIIMANHYSYPYRQGYEDQCDTSKKEYWTGSYIYDWKDGQFDIGGSCCETIFTDSALMWEFYTDRGLSFLAVAELGMDGKSGLSVYQWRNGVFAKMAQPQINARSTQFIEAFTAAGQTYIVRSPGGENQDAEVYSIDSNGQWVLHQGKNITPEQVLMPTGWVTQSKVFTVGNETFLWLGLDPNRNSSDSWIYRWEYVDALQKSVFVPYAYSVDGERRFWRT